MRQATATRPDDFTDHLINVAPAVPALLLALVAVSLHYTADFGVAYGGGIEAWASGHPQRLVLWTGAPFLALVMACITRLAPEFVAARVYMAADLSVWLVLLTAVWQRLRTRVPQAWWWGTLVAAGLFAPAVSTIFWLQFNILVFALALLGFHIAGRHPRWAGVLIGVSVAMKPILVLLPLALLLRRRWRHSAAWAIAAAAALSAAGLGFLAWRAGDPSAADPIAYLQGFLSNGRASIAACIVENYSPAALLCRLGLPPSTPIVVAVAALVVVAAWLLVRNLPDSPEGDWETFAAACFFSPMIGPIDWNHYGVLMAPLFLLLAYQFWREGAPRSMWIGLAAALVLSDLVWDPLASLAGASVPLLDLLYTAGQFGQYFLLLVWIRWRMLRASPARDLVSAPAARPR